MCPMAESNFSSEVPDTDMATLKEALCAQQQLLQKLYFELDEEREASSSAASEAMSMILRLQGEKAQVKMEASQYKREAEEKMCLAEESLAIFEDLMYQKEMEIASLEFQVQAYRCKLLGMGCSDLSIPEHKFQENLQPQRTDPTIAEIGAHRSSVKRHDSLPSLKDYFPKKSITERERSAIPISDLIPRIEVANEDQEVSILSYDFNKKAGIPAGGDLNVYWERIRKLDEQVKEISDGKIPRRVSSINSKNRFRSCSLPPPDPEDSSLSTSPTIEGTATKLGQAKDPKNMVEKKAGPNAVSSSSVQDIFEVPQNNDSQKARGIKEKEQKKLTPESERRSRKPVAEETFESHVKDKIECVNKVPPCPRYKQRDRVSADRQLSLPSATVSASEYQVEIQRLSQRIDRLESKENSTRQEISVEGEAGVKMLKEILDQLNVLQCELKNYKTKKSPPRDDSALRSVNKAMLYFWL